MRVRHQCSNCGTHFGIAKYICPRCGAKDMYPKVVYENLSDPQSWLDVIKEVMWCSSGGNVCLPERVLNESGCRFNSCPAARDERRLNDGCLENSS